VVQELLTLHYDPAYLKSMRRNYSHFDTAPMLPLADAKALTLQAAAKALVAQQNPTPGWVREP
jgi:tRNA 2-selenouridine synthase